MFSVLCTRLPTSFPGFSPTRPHGARERETLGNAGHVSPRIWEITKKRFGGGAGKCEICLYRAYTGQRSHQTVYLTWSWTRKIMHKVLRQRKRNFLQNISMLIGCLSAMLSFGTCDGNRGGFTVNNLGILVVVFIPKRTRLELPFICCGGHFRKQMYSICMCFQDYYYARRRKNVSSVAVLTRDLELPRSNRKREYAARTVRLIVSYCSNGKR